MKKIGALFTAVIFLLTLGIASAQEGSPWEQKETTPLLKDKNGKKETGKKKEQKQKKQKAKKKVKKKQE
ncbi:MAG: hypothetical protein A2010_08390 [Nitrospirae bacterium GWD2_57_9]|nr:MAG: hypothetical protein A2010_08390 [Nitrospirae bacterium GWD2_57_9]OGW46144.1 MAG: hypothetical protein A2078_12275 [Nitrospirae bacterium GWC2_57_9]